MFPVISAVNSTSDATLAFEEDQTSSPEKNCLDDRYWFIFLSSSLLVFFSGAFLIIGARIIAIVTLVCGTKHSSCWNYDQHSRQKRTSIDSLDVQTETNSADETEASCSIIFCYSRIKSQSQALLSGQSVFGRILVSMSCLLSLGSLGIYLYHASVPGAQVETCYSWSASITQQIDFAFNMFFLVYFIIRFLGADDKLSFWLEINSMVDYFTIPPIFVGIAINRQWLGLRFLRAIRLINIPDILQYLRILKTGTLIRLAQLLSIFTSVWLASAGFIHLLELSGDPFYNFENAQDITYWECAYFVVVTMATVGYGDIYCHTTLGRTFIVIFIFGALAMFASFIPEIAGLIQTRPGVYDGYYEKLAGVQHIVVTGYIPYNSVKNFIGDFFHEDRDTKNIKAVFLDSRKPELNLEALFKRHVTKFVFIKGSVMNLQDLHRVRLCEAEACLIMSNPSSEDSQSEDAANIMRVIAVKNFDPRIRVIVQLIHYRNKAMCVNQPSWTSRDQVICLSEMKLGFMAAGCLAPGFSTLIGNLFTMLSYRQTESKDHCWLDDYKRGTGMEVYCEPFAQVFHNRPFREVAKFCYDRLKLLLFAITWENGSTLTEANVMLNPGMEVSITSRTKGFLICGSEEESKRILYYCHQHHGHLEDPSMIRCCSCLEHIVSSYELTATGVGKRKISPIAEHSTEYNDDLRQISIRTVDRYLEFITNNSVRDQNRSSQEGITDLVEDEYELGSLERLQRRDNASFYSNNAREMQSMKMTQPQLFDSTGLFHWCPDRKFEHCILTNGINSSVVQNLTGHVLLCCLSGEGGEEGGDGTGTLSFGLCNFVMPLRASNLAFNELRRIVIIGSYALLRKEWPTICNFPEIYLKLGSALNRSELRFVKVNRCHMCVILTTKVKLSEDTNLSDKESILCTLNIKTMQFYHPDNNPDFSERSQFSSKMKGTSIPILTELANGLNVHFLDQDDDDDPETPFYMTQPFASGRTFVSSVLDTLMITSFFNPESLGLIRNFITGGDTRLLEYILAEGSGLIGVQHRPDPLDTTAMRNRCRPTLLPIYKGILSELSANLYGTLLMRCLENYGILCLGLYRLIPSKDDPTVPNAAGYRFIITNPPQDFQLQPDDKVYCLQPFQSHGSAETKL